MASHVHSERIEFMLYLNVNSWINIIFVFVFILFLNIENTRANVRLIGKKVPRNGIEYVKFDQLLMKVSVGKSRFRLENLFNGDRTLGEIGNQVINENSQLFVDEMIPGFEKSLSKTFLEIANDVLTDVTFDEMFPDV